MIIERAQGAYQFKCVDPPRLKSVLAIGTTNELNLIAAFSAGAVQRCEHSETCRGLRHASRLERAENECG